MTDHPSARQLLNRSGRGSRRTARWATAAGGLVLPLALFSAPASAHVDLVPAAVAPTTFTKFTFSVPNEKQDSDTVEVQVQIPDGFLVEAGQAVSGWRTAVERADNGIITSVTWRGSAIGPGTFAEFAVLGRSPADEGTLAFPVTQRYDDEVVRWDGAADSDNPAPMLEVAEGAAADASGGRVPPAADPATTTPTTEAGEDPLARSRAALALALSGATAIAAGGLLALLLLRRRTLD